MSWSWMTMTPTGVSSPKTMMKIKAVSWRRSPLEWREKEEKRREKEKRTKER